MTPDNGVTDEWGLFLKMTSELRSITVSAAMRSITKLPDACSEVKRLLLLIRASLLAISVGTGVPVLFMS